MLIENWMKTGVVSIPASATVAEAARRMAWHQVGTLPVIDEDGRLVGMLPISDVLAVFLPDFVALLDDLDFLADLGVLESPAPDPARLATSVRELMHEPLSVVRGTGLMLAAAILQRQSVNDICVVDDAGRLLGIASRADVGTALLSEWLTAQSGATDAERAW